MCVEHTYTQHTYIHSTTYIFTYIHTVHTLTYMLADGTMPWAYQTVLQSYEYALLLLLPTQHPKRLNFCSLETLRGSKKHSLVHRVR